LEESNMKERQIDLATIELANNWDISGRGTADVVNRRLRTGKGRSCWRIASLTFLGSLTVAGLFASVAPLPANADDDENSRHGHEDNDKGIRAEIAALKAQVADLQNRVNSLQTSNTTLQSQLAAVQSNHALLLGPFVNVDPNPEIGVIGPNIIFSGANIHIASGSGATNDNGNATGLGNLIIGYDEDPAASPIINVPLKPGDRGGSHNLIIGGFNRFTRAAFGGVVAGENNSISNEGTVVIAGEVNTASGPLASVSGGESNTASGFLASVTGGLENVASGSFGSVSGGQSNTANGFVGASVAGGEANIASGILATVSGGFRNTANGYHTVVLGSQNISDNKDLSIAPQPPFP
jgi:hypothetical protein